MVPKKPIANNSPNTNPIQYVSIHWLNEGVEHSSYERAIKYGDGFFETLLYSAGKIRLGGYHMQRIHQSCQTLGMELPTESLKRLSKVLHSLQEGTYRIRLNFVRSGEGLYLPASQACAVGVEWVEYRPSIQKPITVAYSQRITNCASGISAIKSLSALKYVMASMEAKARGYDDLLILDANGHVSEACYASIVWANGNNLYTPPLSTGCVDGVMIRFLKQPLGLQERLAKPTSWENEWPDSVWLVNALGFRSVYSIENKPLGKHQAVLMDIEELPWELLDDLGL